MCKTSYHSEMFMGVYCPIMSIIPVDQEEQIDFAVKTILDCVQTIGLIRAKHTSLLELKRFLNKEFMGKQTMSRRFIEQGEHYAWLGEESWQATCRPR